MPAKLTQEQFTQKAIEKHNGFYDYSLAEYVNTQTKVKIICPIHGEFSQQPNNHLHGQRCIKCMGDAVKKARCLTTELFISKSREIHGDKYDYSLVNYKKGNNKVIIICKKHGEFLQTPSAHSSPSMKQGCPHCYISKGEDEIEKFLIKNQIEYIHQFKDKNCINPKTNKCLPFDFYIPNLNTIIEYHGEQHYKKMGSYFEDRAGGLEGRQYRDKIKKEFCILNKIRYIEIPYTQYNNIYQILEKICV
jgi:hypothetical protein